MPRISLTDFVDIVSKSGTPKATKVLQVKNRPEYQPAFDFYKPLRDLLVETHKKGKSKFVPEDFLASITDSKKLKNYPGALYGYLKWWGAKDLEWFDPPSGLFGAHGVEIVVNPELGLSINGVPHLIKLYFKSDPLSKQRIDVVVHLMEVSVRDASGGQGTMGVLDTRRSKLVHPTVQIPHLTAALNAELAYIASLWEV